MNGCKDTSLNHNMKQGGILATIHVVEECFTGNSVVCLVHLDHMKIKILCVVSPVEKNLYLVVLVFWKHRHKNISLVFAKCPNSSSVLPVNYHCLSLWYIIIKLSYQTILSILSYWDINSSITASQACLRITAITEAGNHSFQRLISQSIHSSYSSLGILKWNIGSIIDSNPVMTMQRLPHIWLDIKELVHWDKFKAP